MTDAFGESAPWTVGVEEEVMILDASTLALVPAVGELVEAASGLGLDGTVKTELFASVAELTTGVCADAEEATAQLRELRTGVTGAADGLGLRIAAAGSHPFSPPERQEIVPEERYRTFVDYGGSSVRRQGVSGLHVHVGMPDGETCYRVLEGILPWLPLVLALSANSPYLSGEETGLLSVRAQILGLLPRSGAPPACASYEGWLALVERFTSSGLPVADDATNFWWDVRPHPRYGTLEVRMPDQPTSLEVTHAFVDLLQRLCRALAARGLPPVDPARRADYAQNRWAAAAHGPRAVLLHPARPGVVTVAELTAELEELIGPIGLDPARCEGDRQLEVGRTGSLEAVCADLVERSLASP